MSAARMSNSDPLIQPPLPYEKNALTPFLSEEQVFYHYGKHHAGYFKNLGVLLADKPEAKWTLEEIIDKSTGSLFNNAAQAWNHSFFWNCVAPEGGGEPTGELARAIHEDFGSYNKFQEQFQAAAATLFGSGWVWLAATREGKLEIISTSNADTPLKIEKLPLLAIDVWEHAYYIDYRNERAKFIAGFMKKINWPFAEAQFAGGGRRRAEG